MKRLFVSCLSFIFLALGWADLSAQQQVLEPEVIEEAEAKESLAQLEWETWTSLLADEQQQGLQEMVSLRLDCDEQALYIRFEVPASLPYPVFQEGQPAWKVELSLEDPLPAENAEDEQGLSWNFVDDALRESQLENGVRLLESVELDDAVRLEINIPRVLAEKEIPWGANGPAIPFALKAKFALQNYASTTDADTLQQENPPQANEESDDELLNSEAAVEIIFSTGFEPEGALQSVLVPVP